MGWWSRRFGTLLVALFTTACASTSSPRASSPTNASAAPTTSSTTPAPIDVTPPARVGSLALSVVNAPGVLTPRTQWLRIGRPDGVVQYAAVYRPARAGRYPAVVYLHGST